MNERIETEMISRRKALSLLGLGAALGFTLSAALEPLEAEAQEATGPPPRPLRPPEHTGCNGGKGGALIAMSDGTAATSDAMSGERARNQRRPPAARSGAIGGPSAFERQIARSDGLQNCICVRRTTQCARPQTKRKGGDESTPLPQNHTGKHLVMTELLRRGFEAELAGASYEKHDMLVRVGGSRPKPIRIKTVHSAPWYVRWDLFAKRADQVTVYVLLGAETETPARFFVVKNSDLAAQFRQPPTWKAFGFIDVELVEKYEDNWDILK